MVDQSTNRRQFLISWASAMAALPTMGCATPPRPICPTDPAVSDLSAPLTIDMHAHIFNGSDLQIREFLAQTVVGRKHSELYEFTQYMGGMLQRLAWKTAPSAKDELRFLDQYRDLGQVCKGDEPTRKQLAPAFQEGYERGRAALLIARDEQVRGRGAAVMGGVGAATLQTAQMGPLIDALPNTFEQYERLRSDKGGASLLSSRADLTGYINFVLHHFNHRHVNAIDYLTTYGKDSPRKVDLLVASMVDYDYWLAKGAPTETRLNDQLDVMERIAVVTGGRVHGFAPFCPFRELMTSDGRSDGDAMRLVKKAVLERGFIGIKLYPPMGFAPWGNANVGNPWASRASFLPPAAVAEGFGVRLDGAMRRLFEWCLKEDVPVMAHANASNGPNAEFEELASASHWKNALNEFEGLRVSFGHFGDTDLDDHDGQQSLSYASLMSDEPGKGRGNVYADSGYFAGILQRDMAVAAAMAKLYGSTPEHLLIERLMYGTDWTMILPQENVEQYLSRFISVMDRLEQSMPAPRLADKFFSGNAVRFLGLGKQGANRRRLEAFYARNQMDNPDWMRKLAT